MNMIIHDDGHTNVVAADGLLPPSDIRARTKNPGFVEGRFDFIVTNPPFGSTVRQTEKAYLHQYRLASKQVDWLNPNSKSAERATQDTEILFIEQCGRYLGPRGYLAIVIPDGILTNSGLQYVREEIEDVFRIVAVVSLPQTTFTATGAGVKSSVLFLRKHPESETERSRKLKQSLKDKARADANFEAEVANLDAQRRRAVAALNARKEFQKLDSAGRRADPRYASAAKKIADEYSEAVEAIRFDVSEQYEAHLRKAVSDYPIFMAIAEDIGYDATGRPTKSNELEQIGEGLARFIANLEDD